MTAMEIVNRLSTAGHKLTVDGENLRVRPQPQAEFYPEIRAAKDAIVALLRERMPASSHRYVIWRGGLADRERSVCISCGIPPVTARARCARRCDGRR